MDSGFPKRVDEQFPGMTSKVTAAFQVRGECDTASKHTTVHYKPRRLKYTKYYFLPSKVFIEYKKIP